MNSMPEPINPWPAVPGRSPYVLSCDVRKIKEYNEKAHEEHKVQLNVLPEPFFGTTTAPVVLLALNPGFNNRDPKVHKDPRFQRLLRNNYSHGRSPFPFYFLNPNFESSGREWWEKKLKFLLDHHEFTREKLAQSLLCVQYFPYHSRRFRKLELPSQEYGFGLVRSAITRGAVIVVMRSKKLWKKKVQELEGYPRAFTLKNPRNIVVSPGNCKRFDDVVSAIRNGK